MNIGKKGLNFSIIPMHSSISRNGSINRMYHVITNIYCIDYNLFYKNTFLVVLPAIIVLVKRETNTVRYIHRRTGSISDQCLSLCCCCTRTKIEHLQQGYNVRKFTVSIAGTYKFILFLLWKRNLYIRLGFWHKLLSLNATANMFSFLYV